MDHWLHHMIDKAARKTSSSVDEHFTEQTIPVSTDDNLDDIIDSHQEYASGLADARDEIPLLDDDESETSFQKDDSTTTESIELETYENEIASHLEKTSYNQKHSQGSTDSSTTTLDSSAFDFYARFQQDPVHLAHMEGNIFVQNNAPWHLGRISHRAKGNKQFRTVPSAGKGVTLYILDGSADTKLKDFGGRASHGPNFVKGESVTNYGTNHGTAVASLAAGATFGVAKKSKIVSLKVLNKNGQGNFANILAGLSWVVQQKQKNGVKAVVNISITGPRSAAVNAQITAAIKAGVHVIVAAGDHATDACKYSPSSNGGSMISVGSTGSNDARSSESNTGKCVSIWAPGRLVATAVGTWIGTSMAAPLVAGVAAAILSTHPTNLSPSVLKNLIENHYATRNKVTSCGSGPNRLVYSMPVQYSTGSSRNIIEDSTSPSTSHHTQFGEL